MFEHVVDACNSGSISAEIDFVFMHREAGEGEGSDAFIKRVHELGIPLQTLSSKKFREQHHGDFAGYRNEFDLEVLDKISQYSVDLLVMAGYLLIASPTLFENHHLLNIHPALPNGPTGLWQQVIWRLIDKRETRSGLTTFIVSHELDRGKLISWAEYPIRGRKFDPLWNEIGNCSSEELMASDGQNSRLFQAIREAGLRREQHLLTETLRIVSESGSDWKNPDWQPRDLTQELETLLRINSIDASN